MQLERLDEHAAAPLDLKEHEGDVMSAIKDLENPKPVADNPVFNEMFLSAFLGPIVALAQVVRSESAPTETKPTQFSSFFDVKGMGRHTKRPEPLMPLSASDLKFFERQNNQRAASAPAQSKGIFERSKISGMSLNNPSPKGIKVDGRSKFAGLEIKKLQIELGNTRRAKANPFSSPARLMEGLKAGNDAAENLVQRKPEVVAGIFAPPPPHKH